MAIIDKKGRLFGKLNIFDLFIVLALIGFAVGFAVKINLPDKLNIVTEKEKIEFTVKVEKVRPELLEYLKKGDNIWSVDSKAKIGVIEEIKSENAKFSIERSDGVNVIDTTDMRLDLTVKILTEGVINDDGVILTGTKNNILKSSEFIFYSENAVCYGYVLDMSIINVQNN